MRIYLTDASIKTWSDDGDIHFVLMKLSQLKFTKAIVGGEE